jgi:histidine triad (HIT) family protein
MASIFTKIIDGDLPARFVWKDDRCVAFLSVAPVAPGHTLVVPRTEVDHWIDLDADVLAHLTEVSRTIGLALQHGFNPVKIGVMIAGLEAPHAHIHLVPISSEGDLRFENEDRNPDPAALDAAAETIRASLRELGHGEFVA